MSAYDHQKTSTGRNIGLGVLIIAALTGLFVAAYVIGFDHGKPDKKQTQAVTAPGGGDPKQLFTTTCGGCHEFKAAGTAAGVGPNLDGLKPTEPVVINQIKNGGGSMPAGLLEGAEATAVAKFVADNAGK